ncbi:hypothetical protein EW026_g3906 [Hermanssonia centrifuga]|uniref:NADP-dependent oxidoreductase domain-containing protein n=1 Tax=Hermanssonia centrifuga TaxID=98765 RepID=A0A4S4KJ70_9APHY|nr:hypothetical protein EW026_g3906 [Hermanssonia centrifuga]
MPFRRLGNTGLRVPLMSLGGWLTLGGSVKGDPVSDIIKVAFENGINMIDTAEAYAKGESEIAIGRSIKTLGIRRTDLIVTTKLFWGLRSGPNDGGLSRKHIIEGTKEALERLQMDYVDVIFAHRPDPTIPMEEVVRAFNWVIEKGWVRTLVLSQAIEIYILSRPSTGVHQNGAPERPRKLSVDVAHKLNLIPPAADQCEHHMFHRERPEKEYEPLYRKYDYGTTVFSGLAQGLLTGKYNDGIPEDSRFAKEKHPMYDELRAGLTSEEGKTKIKKIKDLTAFAETELNCKISHLALAWLAVKPHTSTIILGASKPEQVLDNLKALEVLPKLTPAVLEKIEEILATQPAPVNQFGRFPLAGHLPKI